jgi:phosphatidylglycerophosphate synthase
LAKTITKTRRKGKNVARRPKAKHSQSDAVPDVPATQPAVAVPVAQPGVPIDEVRAHFAEMSFEPSLCIFGQSQSRLWGRSLPERLRLMFARAGVVNEISIKDAPRHKGPIIMVRADAVLDVPLVAAIIKRPNFILLGSNECRGDIIAAHFRSQDVSRVVAAFEFNSSAGMDGFMVRAPEEMDASYWKQLRKKESPYAMRLTDTNIGVLEWRMFMGTYKGATDFVTKHLWPRPAFHVTRWIAPTFITPNIVTMASAVLMALAFYLFLSGLYWPGLVAAWGMTFLDTVDGKLARTTLTSSKWGDIFDHGIDLIHPPFWYGAWIWGLSSWGISWPNDTITWMLVAILGGYVLQRLIEGAAIGLLGLEIHIWRPIDTFFRQITARRNPNLALLTLFMVIQKPDWGIVAVAIWTVVCLLLHIVQIIQAFYVKRTSGKALQSWLNAP